MSIEGCRQLRGTLLFTLLLAPNSACHNAVACPLLQERVKFHVLLTTYEMVSKHLADIRRLEWAALVVDEAHRLKNANSRLFQVCGCVCGTAEYVRR
jgi:hypothetical protein